MWIQKFERLKKTLGRTTIAVLLIAGLIAGGALFLSLLPPLGASGAENAAKTVASTVSGK